MVSLLTLWLPILLGAVIVFLASWIMHVVLPYHRGDFKKLPDEEKILEAMRAAGVAPGAYTFPCAPSHKECASPEMIEKYNAGPVGMMTVLPSRMPVMWKHLMLWFVYCLVVGFLVAYLASRTVSAGAEYLAVFRVVGATAFLAYAGSQAVESIWMGRPWSVTVKNVLDGLVYGLLTAGTFSWLWP